MSEDKKDFISLQQFLDEATEEEKEEFYSRARKEMQEQFKEFNSTLKKMVEEKLEIPAVLGDFKETMELMKDTVERVERWRKANNYSMSDIDKMDFRVVYQLVKEWENSNETIELETLESIFPTSYIMPNNKLANSIDKIKHEANLIVKNHDLPEKQVLTNVTINYDDENIQIYDKDKRFTPYDRAVHNAVCSIYEAGNELFTPDQVYRVMNGLDDSQYVGPQAKGAVTKSIDKMRRMYTKVVYTDEARERGLDVEKAEFEDHILSVKKVTLAAGGKEVTGYKFNGSKPLIYEYAQFTKQVLTVPIELLNTKDVIRSTPEVIVIREYLIRRIEVMKENKDTSNKILFERIFNEIDHPEPTTDKARKVRNNVEKLLSKFKKEKYIKDFKFYKSGRAFKGIEIVY